MQPSHSSLPLYANRLISRRLTAPRCIISLQSLPAPYPNAEALCRACKRAPNHPGFPPLRYPVLMSLRPFHIAFPVDDLAAARHFYGNVLGCPEGRSAAHWVDFNLFGHQIVAHLKPRPDSSHAGRDTPHSSSVDNHDVPIPHFGVVLTQPDWEALADRVRAAGVHFIIEPYTRFKGEIGEQSTMFFLDPAGNALEFKAFADLSNMFAK